MINEKTKNNFLMALMIITAIILVIFEFADIKLSSDQTINEMLTMIVSRGIGGIYAIICIYILGFKILNPVRRPFFKSLLVTLPCFVIVINNLPIIALATGNAYVTQPLSSVMMLALECFFVGLFEEGIFRGIIFLLILERAEKSTIGVFKAIITSSAIFGGIHIFNLLAGADILSVILQIGYSFLMGGMWAAVLLKTKNLFLCMTLHAVYNFCGLLLPTLGGGNWWDTPTIIITVLLSIVLAIYIIRMIAKIDPLKIDVFKAAPQAADSD